MRRLVVLCLLAGVVVGGMIAGFALTRNPHQFSGRCEECHLTAPQPGQKGIFVYDIDYLCLRCHELSQKNSHPSEVAPSMAMPDGFVLDWQGRITCATCHDPHVSDLDRHPDMLRGEATGKAFCIQCHQGFYDDPEKHLAVLGMAHNKSRTPPAAGTLAGQLDEVSLVCISCHEGSVAKVASYRIAAQDDGTLSFKGRNFSHPIGMDYADLAYLNRELRPVDALADFVSLYEGKVGCASCHNPFSREQDMLVINNRGSRLCLECHRK